MTATIQEEGQDQHKEYVKSKTKVKDLYVKNPVVVRVWNPRFRLDVEYTIEEETAMRHISLYSQSVLRKRYKLWFDIYKRDFRCIVCKNDDTEVLDFHHLDRKIKKCSISSMIGGCMKLQDIQAELKKCIAVCLHCHRKIENGSISKDEVMEKENEEYYGIGKPRPGENILDDFPTIMLAVGGFTIVYRYDVHYIKNERILHNFKESEDDYYSSEERHPDYVDFCKKRIVTKDTDVDIELDKPDVMGEFDRGFSDIDLY